MNVTATSVVGGCGFEYIILLKVCTEKINRAYEQCSMRREHVSGNKVDLEVVAVLLNDTVQDLFNL